jgi:cytochrome c biogenesis protein CcmG/thiol:disulfide interchange protein DsbE
MLCISTTILIALSALTQSTTPDRWADDQLDVIDKKAMEQLISFAPPPVSPDTIWILPEGEDPIRWDQCKGKVVVVQTWSNTNIKSKQIVGATKSALSNNETPEEIVFITIHTPDGAENLGNTKTKILAPTIIDTNGELCNQFGFFKDPTNVIIDRDGAVRYVGLGIRGLISAVDVLLMKPHNPKATIKQFEPKQDGMTVPINYPPHNTKYGRSKNQQGKLAPKFEVEQWISKQIDINNKVRIIEFWATWCPPCKKAIPHMNEYASHFKDEVVFIGISNEPASKVQNFTKQTNMEYGVAIDTQSRMKDSISCSAIPLALVISSDGIVRWQGNPLNLSKRLIQQVLSADRGETIEITRGRWNTTTKK